MAITMSTLRSAIPLASILLQCSFSPAAGRGVAPPSPAFLHPARRPLLARRSAAAIDNAPADDSEDGGNVVVESRDRLVALSSTLADESPSGRFLTRPSDKRDLRKAVQELEGLAPAGGDAARDLMLGDWTLIATATYPSFGLDKKRNKKDDDGRETRSKSLNPIQKSIRKTIEVTQRIRDDGNASSSDGSINRVDNVVEFTPLNTLEDILPEESPLFNLLGKVNVNPLQVKKSKVVLVHNAEVESVAPVLRTKIAWVSSILNVAGSSQFLDPEGEDVFGVNNLFGEFAGVGTFDTPFVDGSVRVSRTSGPVSEQLRVFVRQGSAPLQDDAEETKATTTNNGDDVGIKAKKVVDAATSLAENAREVIEKDMEDVTTALGDKMDDVVFKVQDAVEDDLERIKEAVEEVQSAVQGDGGDVGRAIADATRAAAKVPGDVAGIVEDDRAELEGELRQAMDAMVADVQDSVEEDLRSVGKSLEEMRDAVIGSDDAKEEVKEVEEEAKEVEAVEEETKEEEEETKEEE